MERLALVHVCLRSDRIYFPPVDEATDDGLLMVGGGLTPQWLKAAYTRGIFPWPVETDIGSVLAWFSPDPRAIVELDSLHISRRLARRIRSGKYRVTFNTCFADVISECAAPRAAARDYDEEEADALSEDEFDDNSGTWITPELAHAYVELHRRGMAHSVEVWEHDTLVGGLYGVTFGGLFSGESMFHRVRDASKIALAFLVPRLRERGFSLFDIQQFTPHMASLGAIEVSRSEYLKRLKRALEIRTALA